MRCQGGAAVVQPCSGTENIRLIDQAPRFQAAPVALFSEELDALPGVLRLGCAARRTIHLNIAAAVLTKVGLCSCTAAAGELGPPITSVLHGWRQRRRLCLQVHDGALWCTTRSPTVIGVYSLLFRWRCWCWPPWGASPCGAPCSLTSTALVLQVLDFNIRWRCWCWRPWGGSPCGAQCSLTSAPRWQSSPTA